MLFRISSETSSIRATCQAHEMKHTGSASALAANTSVAREKKHTKLGRVEALAASRFGQQHPQAQFLDEM